MKSSDKMLLALTTANELEYTKKCLNTLESSMNQIDLLVIDDASNDGTPEYCRKYGATVICKNTAKGLTDSWNEAYRYFIKNDYQKMILSNNDVLFPDSFIDDLSGHLDQYVIVGVLTHVNGICGHEYSKHVVTNYYNLPFDPKLPSNYQSVQNLINQDRNRKVVETDLINGFCFGLSKKVSKYEIRSGVLFDENTVNVRNDYKLSRRIKEKKVISLKTFIYHYKSVSVQNDCLGKWMPRHAQRELTWMERDRIRSSVKERIVFFLRSVINWLR